MNLCSPIAQGLGMLTRSAEGCELGKTKMKHLSLQNWCCEMYGGQIPSKIGNGLLWNSCDYINKGKLLGL